MQLRRRSQLSVSGCREQTSPSGRVSGCWRVSAVEEFRKLIGATNPAEAEEGTIRNLYATSMGENAVHGSDSDANAEIEGAFHFSSEEILS